MILGITIGLLFFLVGALFLQGLRKITVDPPHKAVVTKRGERQEVKEKVKEKEIDKKTGEEKIVDTLTLYKKTLYKNEGWRFFFLCPYWYGYIEVDVTRKNPDFPIQSVRTPDMGEIDIPLTITYTPDPDHLIEYLNNKGEKGVEDILEDIVRQRLREWAIAAEEGPQTWEDAMKAREEAVLVLAKAILGDELPRIEKKEGIYSEVPTSIWFKHFYYSAFAEDKQPLKYPDEEEEDFERRKKEWEKWKELIKKEETEVKTKEEKTPYMKEQIEKRKNEVDALRRGNGDKKIKHLGIILNRLNLGEFKIKGKLAEAAELRAKEKREMMAEKFELDHVEHRIKNLIKLGFSREQSLEIVQTERGKVKKEIKESKWNVSQETRQMIEKIGLKMTERI